MPLLAFVAVVALIPVVLWLMRRSGLGGAAQGNLMRVVSSLSLSPSQKLVIV
jgi:flagellar protein FliO/FliZ